MMNFSEAINCIHQTPLEELKRQHVLELLVPGAAFINASSEEKETPRALNAFFKLSAAFPVLPLMFERHRVAYHKFFDEMRKGIEHETFQWVNVRKNWDRLSFEKFTLYNDRVVGLLSLAYGTNKPITSYEEKIVNDSDSYIGGFHSSDPSRITIYDIKSAQTGKRVTSFEMGNIIVAHEKAHDEQDHQVNQFLEQPVLDDNDPAAIENGILAFTGSVPPYTPPRIQTLLGVDFKTAKRLYQCRPTERDAHRATCIFIDGFKQLLHQYAGFDPSRGRACITSLPPLDQIARRDLDGMRNIDQNIIGSI
jgi:hypothetical protein